MSTQPITLSSTISITPPNFAAHAKKANQHKQIVHSQPVNSSVNKNVVSNNTTNINVLHDRTNIESRLTTTTNNDKTNRSVNTTSKKKHNKRKITESSEESQINDHDDVIVYDPQNNDKTTDNSRRISVIHEVDNDDDDMLENDVTVNNKDNDNDNNSTKENDTSTDSVVNNNDNEVDESDNDNDNDNNSSADNFDNDESHDSDNPLYNDDNNESDYVRANDKKLPHKIRKSFLAIYNYLESDKYKSLHKQTRNDRAADIYAELGDIFYEHGVYKQCIRYMNRSIQCMNQGNGVYNNRLIAYQRCTEASHELSKAYEKNFDYDNASQSLQQALKYVRKHIDYSIKHKSHKKAEYRIEGIANLANAYYIQADVLCSKAELKTQQYDISIDCINKAKISTRHAEQVQKQIIAKTDKQKSDKAIVGGNVFTMYANIELCNMRLMNRQIESMKYYDIANMIVNNVNNDIDTIKLLEGNSVYWPLDENNDEISKLITERNDMSKKAITYLETARKHYKSAIRSDAELYDAISYHKIGESYTINNQSNEAVTYYLSSGLNAKDSLKLDMHDKHKQARILSLSGNRKVDTMFDSYLNICTVKRDAGDYNGTIEAANEFIKLYHAYDKYQDVQLEFKDRYNIVISCKNIADNVMNNPTYNNLIKQYNELSSVDNSNNNVIERIDVLQKIATSCTKVYNDYQYHSIWYIQQAVTCYIIIESLIHKLDNKIKVADLQLILANVYSNYCLYCNKQVLRPFNDQITNCLNNILQKVDRLFDSTYNTYIDHNMIEQAALLIFNKVECQQKHIVSYTDLAKQIEQGIQLLSNNVNKIDSNKRISLTYLYYDMLCDIYDNQYDRFNEQIDENKDNKQVVTDLTKQRDQVIEVAEQYGVQRDAYNADIQAANAKDVLDNIGELLDNMNDVLHIVHDIDNNDNDNDNQQQDNNYAPDDNELVDNNESQLNNNNNANNEQQQKHTIRQSKRRLSDENNNTKQHIEQQAKRIKQQQINNSSSSNDNDIVEIGDTEEYSDDDGDDNVYDITGQRSLNSWARTMSPNQRIKQQERNTNKRKQSKLDQHIINDYQIHANDNIQQQHRTKLTLNTTLNHYGQQLTRRYNRKQAIQQAHNHISNNTYNYNYNKYGTSRHLGKRHTTVRDISTIPNTNYIIRSDSSNNIQQLSTTATTQQLYQTNTSTTAIQQQQQQQPQTIIVNNHYHQHHHHLAKLPDKLYNNNSNSYNNNNYTRQTNNVNSSSVIQSKQPIQQQSRPIQQHSQQPSTQRNIYNQRQQQPVSKPVSKPIQSNNNILQTNVSNNIEIISSYNNNITINNTIQVTIKLDTTSTTNHHQSTDQEYNFDITIDNQQYSLIHIFKQIESYYLRHYNQPIKVIEIEQKDDRRPWNIQHRSTKDAKIYELYKYATTMKHNKVILTAYAITNGILLSDIYIQHCTSQNCIPNQQIADMLIQYDNNTVALTTLSLTDYIGLQTEHYIALLRTLCQQNIDNNITTIILDHCNIKHEGIVELSNLIQHNKYNNVSKLSCQQLILTPDTWIVLIKSLIKLNKLQYLNISYNTTIHDTHITYITQLLQSRIINYQHTASQLQYIDISYCSITGVMNFDQFTQIISQTNNLTSFNISHNPLILSAICKLLQSIHTSKITHLSLGNMKSMNNITHKSTTENIKQLDQIYDILHQLLIPSITLQTQQNTYNNLKLIKLDISYWLLNNRMIDILIQYITSKLCTLQYLILQCCSIDQTNIQRLFDAIQHHTADTLHTIDLSHIVLNRTSINNLLWMIKENKTLEKLILHGCMIQHDKEYYEFEKSLNTDIYQHCSIKL